MTTLGAGLVFFFRKQFSAGLQRVFLGFAAGVMIAAAVWSLLIPAIDQAEAAGLLGWLPAAGGIGATAGLHLWRRSIGLSLIGGTGVYVALSLLLG